MFEGLVSAVFHLSSDNYLANEFFCKGFYFCQIDSNFLTILIIIQLHLEVGELILSFKVLQALFHRAVCF